MKDGQQEIKEAAAEAVTVIANAASEAARVIANSAAVAAMRSQDHDILIELKGDMTTLKSSVLEIKNSDHEARIRSLEKSMTKVFTYGYVGLVILGIVQFLIAKYT